MSAPKTQAEGPEKWDEPAREADERPACGPGCDCSAPSGGKGIKIAITLLVLAALVGILIYKATSAKSSASDASPVVQDSIFPVAREAPAIAPETATHSSEVVADKKSVDDAASIVQSDEQDAEKPQPAPPPNRIGASLESLSDLNKVALSQDAVFIFIPSAKNAEIRDQTNTAVLAAQQRLKRSNITVGLYTLAANSSDYSTIVAQVQAPAILVARKGRGMRAVSGEVTETKLLQAFMASSRAGGCCPSGSSSPGCK